jgi:putative glutamine amidotransferase
MRIAVTLDRDADVSETSDYVRSLLAAGMPRQSITVVTPLSPEAGAFDALVLGGGVDVDPARYGRVRLDNGTVEVDPERDELDFRLFEEARRAGVPVFAICRGLQVVNVAAGGTLVQDIPSERPSSVVHQRGRDEKTRRDHAVAIAPRTLLAAVAGPGEPSVNSRHHQAIEDLGRGLSITAVAPDGLPEAIEAPADPWLVGVQWHPENLLGDRVSERLFAEFLRASRERLSARGRSQE